jgi:hypothetical protein
LIGKRYWRTRPALGRARKAEAPFGMPSWLPVSGIKRTWPDRAGWSQFDPNVWSGRASQEDFVELAAAVLHQCIRPPIGACRAPGHHGYQRACVLISGQASIGPLGSPVFARARKTDPPFVLSSRRPRLETLIGLRHRLLLLSRSSFVRAKGRSLVPARRTSIASRAGAVKAGRRAGLAAGSGVARPRLDRAEHGARIKRVGRLHRRSSSARRRVL